ncbi:CheR family methyltransferase [Enterovibrio calviensis]|uniref:CheR family methyltransferase n=1 Tax=Enterovibrio calviensis TaxID=91359 RepID=UPI000485F3CF|nr:protein-glutamate O-methyltransferase CheR [Enterovibrio calviensis]
MHSENPDQIEPYFVEPMCIGDAEEMSKQEFDYFSTLIFQHAGIKLEVEKRSMLEMRLLKRLRALKLGSFGEYMRVLKQDTSGIELIAFTNLITTNKTSFFREQRHFNVLREDILKRTRPEKTFIWSAACSSGEEPYSLAMQCEVIKSEQANFDYRILATDVDTQRLDMCALAEYPDEQREDIPKLYQHQYIQRITRDSDTFTVVERLKQNIKFRQHNLIHYPEKFGIQFHYIFLRNVLFYFPPSTGEKVVRALVSQLQPGGLFFVGLTESLQHMDVGLELVDVSVYRKPELGDARDE